MNFKRKRIRFVVLNFLDQINNLYKNVYLTNTDETTVITKVLKNAIKLMSFKVGFFFVYVLSSKMQMLLTPNMSYPGSFKKNHDPYMK